ncbi:uncharacterized protein LOC8268739 [Ricinus communis]|uniref:DUF241 domain protein n=1 Tax=Ricinus communis TaxID=3988 RepID=B9S6R5_RICCO|nr:uncharacterized protein LOC8268739 [Ricinus communis]EEF40671.1 conserved hypothetical protein [Ricinus communis]|eukprot:XP_002521684.1 uncharacterized protein LOC8268739 [Ricinus communis]
MASKYRTRSISLPSRSHPNTLRIEGELNKLKTLDASSSGSVCIGLSGLEDLYNGFNDLLNMSTAQEVLTHSRNEKCLDELLDGSVKLLDICGITRDVMLQFKEQVQSLQSALRRRKGDSSIETSISGYTCFRKKMKKDAKTFVANLKQMDSKLEASKFQYQEDLYLIQLFKQVILINSFIFQSLLSFLASSKPKQSRWSVASKLMHKRAIACEEKQEIVNELESVDSALAEKTNSEKMQIAKRRLEALEMGIQDIEICLERVFRHLVKTRASILNIISQ